MKLLKSIKSAVLKTLESVSTEGDNELCTDMLELAAARYKEKYGYVPEVWSKVMSVSDELKLFLLDYGYSLKRVNKMSVQQLRDEVKKYSISS